MNFVDVELLLGNMGGHGAGEVPSRNTVGRTKMRPLFCSRLYPMACTSLATVAENVVCLVGLNWSRNRMHVVTPLFNNVHSSSSFLITSNIFTRECGPCPIPSQGKVTK